jgi:hypothetical protein
MDISSIISKDPLIVTMMKKRKGVRRAGAKSNPQRNRKMAIKSRVKEMSRLKEKSNLNLESSHRLENKPGKEHHRPNFTYTVFQS